MSASPSKFTATAYLALDVSTSCTGIAAFDAAGVLLGTLYHVPLSVTKKRPLAGHFLMKAQGLAQVLEEFRGCPVRKVWIEEPLAAANNAKTVNTLLRYNGVASLHCYQLLGVLPEYLTVYEWRRALCPEFLKLKAGAAGARGEKTWQMPKGQDPKEYIFNKVKYWHPGADWAYNTEGKLLGVSMDMSDAVGVGTAALLAEGVLDWDELAARYQRPRVRRT